MTRARIPDPGEAVASEAWWQDAACRGQDPLLFFPDQSDGRTAAAAKAFCAVCPVVSECLEYALSMGPAVAGIWGGLGEKQRRQLRRKRAALRNGGRA